MDFSYIMNLKMYAEYCTVGKFLSEKRPMIHQRRTLDSFVLIYGVSGTLHISDGGREYDVSPNDYLILAAGREHIGTAYSPPGISYYWCHFYLRGDYELLCRESERLVLGNKGEHSIPMFGHCNNSSRMHLLFHQLMDCSRTPTEFSGPMCQSFLDIILMELMSSGCEPERMQSRADATVANILEWIRINAAGIRGVDDVARYFGYNSEYLTTLIKRVTGKTTVDHINESRILLARELLRTTDAKLREIAERCGYTDEKYFSRVFKRLCDISPSEFRRVYQKKHINDR